MAQYLAEDLAENTPQPNFNSTAENSNPETNLDAIAIVGMGCRFPRAENIEAFWDLLSQGIDGITEIPPERWNINSYYDPTSATVGKMNTKWGGFLSRLDEFDAVFFGISRREARRIDPQQRLLLEVTWEALENAGIAPEQIAGSKTGVYVGISSHDYSAEQLRDITEIDAYLGIGNAHSISANRLSYTFDLKGPSVACDTACSSSLFSLHLACQSLRSQESDMAIVGGVNAILEPQLTINFSNAGMMSPTGRCRTFDAQADGYVRSEGCGVVIIKRLSDAIRDGNTILGLVRGSAVNQDGKSNGITAPNGPSQQAVMRQALQKAGVKPQQISYDEAHGTGTPLGDPIEMRSIQTVLGENRHGKCFVGSVKTNIGHLESAAGIASLIKVVLSLQHKQIPANLHFQNLNPHIQEDTGFDIPQACLPWETNSQPRLAGINSFGFGGSNVHVILEEAPQVSLDNNNQNRSHHILTLSAKNQTALSQLAAKFSQHISNNPEQKLADICFSANSGRTHMSHRLAVIASDRQELITSLNNYNNHQTAKNLHQGEIENKPKICFLFTGQGSQYQQMGEKLYQQHPEFKATVDKCAAILEPQLNEQPLLSVLFGENQHLLQQTSYTQLGIFVIEYALYQLWQSWGVKPDVVMGHSLGEYVAATVAGVMSLESALLLVATRGKLMQALPSNGAMAAVFAPVEKISPYLNNQVEIAGFNGPQNTVISGDANAVEQVCQQLETAGIYVHRLSVASGFHSRLMEPMLEEFAAVARTISFQKPQIKLVSNLTGKPIERAMDADYWCEQIRRPVHFAQGIECLDKEGYSCFVEIGAHPILSGMAQKIVADSNHNFLPSLRREDKT